MGNMIEIESSFRELASSWLKVYDSGQYTEGHFVHALEKEVERITGQYCVAMNSCGSGLYALYSLLGKSSWHVPYNTFYATGGMVVQAGKQIKSYIDCGLDGSLSFESVEEHVYSGDALVLTHVGGTLASDYQTIAGYCQDQGITLIEDAAHAFGAITDEGHHAGSFSAAAVFSLYPTKAMPAGEGGLVVTSSKELANQLRRFRNYGKIEANGATRYTGGGMNLRMSEWDAVVAYHQVCNLGVILANRRYDAARLSKIVRPKVSGFGGNFYKYIVDHEDFEAEGLQRETGKVYTTNDQMGNLLLPNQINPCPRAKEFSDNHRCLPIGNGMYRGKSDLNIINYLKGGEL